MTLPEDVFLEVVRNSPLVSVDLVVRDRSGRVLLGRRTNQPARGSLFVPGGVIHKGETIAEALQRVYRAELGAELGEQPVRFLGVYQHFYDDNFAAVPGVNTHYIVLAYEIGPVEGVVLHPDPQHELLIWMRVSDVLAAADVHENTKAYFQQD